MGKSKLRAIVAPCAVVAGTLLFSTAARGAVLSFNAVGATTGGMTSTDTAGAPGASVANWNNMNSLQTTAGGAITGSLVAGTVVNDSGVVQAATTVSWTGTGVANAAGGGTNSQKMFESEWDLFDSGGNTAVADMVITVSNVPYALYDVYFYVQDANGVANRGGDVTANTKTESIKMYTNAADIPGGTFNYSEADSQFTFNATNTSLGTFLRIADVTGSTLTLTMSSKNVTTPRLRFSGFQIAEVPEPGSAALLGVAAAAALLARRRRAAVSM